MSEDAYKRRLRARKRSIAAMLKRDGYRVHPCDGAFHLMACRGKTARMIRISFGEVHYDETMVVKREPVPARCVREIWKFSSNGIGITRVVIE